MTGSEHLPSAEPPAVALDVALEQRIAASPATPLITGYDEATGDRAELSGTTFGTWVAKTANLLRDGLGVQQGDVVTIDLPLHWLLPVWLGACAAVGAVAAPGGDPASAAVAVCGPHGMQAALAAPEVMACSLRPLAMPFPGPLPTGVDDYCLEVRSYPDRFAPSWRPRRDEVAWHWDGRDLSGAEVLAAAAALAARTGVGPGGRLLTTRAASGLDGLLAVLGVPLVSSGSVVMVAGEVSAQRLARIGGDEGVTAALS